MLQIEVNEECDKNGLISPSNTALHKACIECRNNEVEKLLRQKTVDKNAKNCDGRTPLSLAAEYGYLEIVALFLKFSEVDVKITDNNSLTALHYACIGGHFDVIRKLTEKEENFKALFTFEAENEPSPLQSVVYSGSQRSQDVAIKLLKYIAERKQLKQLIETNQRLLSIAASNGKKEVVEHLLKCCEGVSMVDERSRIVQMLTEEDSDGLTPVHCAVFGPKGCAADIVDLLVNKIEQLKQQTQLDKRTKTDGRTALHLAAETNIDVVKKLNKLDPSARDNYDNTPLLLCVQTMAVDEVRILLDVFQSSQGKLRFDIDSVNKNGESALVIGIKLLDKEKVAMLIDYGANLIITNTHGVKTTVLHWLVDMTCIEPDLSLVEAICNTIFEKLVTWWCGKKNNNVPLKCSKMYEVCRQKALTELMECGKLNFLQYAARQGAHDLLALLVDKYCTHGDMYNVTWITYETMPECPQTGICYQCDSSSVARMPVLKHIINGRQSDTMILRMEPFKSIVRPYLAINNALNIVALLCHLTFMIVFTNYALTDRLINKNEASNITAPTTSDNFDDNTGDGTCIISQNLGLFSFCIWPLFNFIYDILNSIHLLQMSKYFQVEFLIDFKSKLPKRHRYENKLNVWIDHMLFDLLFSVCLFGTVMIWCLTHVTCEHPVMRLVSMSLAFLIGWSYMINYISNVNKNVALLVTILKKIFIHDMLRFFLLYFFILLSFGLSFHALTSAKDVTTAIVGPIVQTVYATFRQILGIEDVRTSLEFGRTMHGMNVMDFADVLYVAYSITSTVVLLNLLIAMMSGTYGDAVQRAKEVLVSCDMYAIDGMMRLECCCPSLMRCLLRQQFVCTNGNEIGSEKSPDMSRWFMKKDKFVQSCDEPDENQYQILTEIAKCHTDVGKLREEERYNSSDIKSQLEVVLKEQKRLREDLLSLHARVLNSVSGTESKTEPDIRHFQPLRERSPYRSKSPSTVILARK